MRANRDLQTRMRERVSIVVEMLCFIRNINKTDLAKRVGISRTTMHNFITRKTYTMKYETLIDIFDILKFDIMDAVAISNKNCSREIMLALVLQEVLKRNKVC